MIYAKIQVFLQPFNIASVLFALYGVNVAFMSFKNVNPGTSNLYIMYNKIIYIFFTNL